MTLEKLVSKLGVEFEQKNCLDGCLNLKNDVIQRLKKKISRLNSKLPPNTIQLYHEYLLKNESNFFDCSQLDDFKILFRRDIDILFYFRMKNNETIKSTFFTEKNGVPIECYRDDNAFHIPSPENNKIQSWAKLQYISKETYKKHWHEKKHAGVASKFLDNIEITNLEKLIFQNGFGHFGRKTNEIFLYGKFSKPIGTTIQNQETKKTEYIKVQLNRVLRPRKKVMLKGKPINRIDGYMTEIHGYPISRSELFADFPAGSNIVESNIVQV